MGGEIRLEPSEEAASLGDSMRIKCFAGEAEGVVVWYLPGGSRDQKIFYQVLRHVAFCNFVIIYYNFNYYDYYL